MVRVEILTACLLLLIGEIHVEGKNVCVEEKHLKLCEKSNSTLTDLTNLVRQNKDSWKRNCTKQREVLKEVMKHVSAFNEATNKPLPGRKILSAMSPECDDIISSMKGVIKRTKDMKMKEVTCKEHKKEIAQFASNIANSIFRCGFGKREQVISQSTIVEKKVLVGRKKRDTIEKEVEVNFINEIEDLGEEGKDGIVNFNRGGKEAPVEDAIMALAKLRGIKINRAEARSLGLTIEVEHKCSCKDKDCKCCLLIHNGNKEANKLAKKEPWSACLGIEMVKECKKSGVKIFVSVLGLSAEFVIMEKSSACYNFPSLPISLCIEPYGFHFCPRRKTFRSCLMLQFEVLGFRLASYDLNCVVLSHTLDGGIGLRLRDAKPSWRPEQGIITVLFNWISDIFVSQYKK